MITTSKRNAKYELVRVLAMMLVLVYYVFNVCPLNITLNHTELDHIVFSILYKLAAPFFLFLCGRFSLNLDFTNKSLKEFYFKKMVYIIIPMLFFMACSYVIDHVQKINDLIFFEFLPYVTRGYKNIHYWFMYKVLFYILFAPILSVMFKDISDRGVKSFVAVGLIYNLLVYYVNLVPNVDFSYLNQYGNLIFYFFLGGMSDKIVNLTGKKKLYIAGATSLLVVFINTYLFEPASDKYDCSPFYVIFAFSVYIYLTSLYIEGNKIIDNILLFLGKYSFYICMIQGIIIKFIANSEMLPANNKILFICSGVAVSLIISVVLAVVIDILIFKYMRIGLFHLCKIYNNIK